MNTSELVSIVIPAYKPEFFEKALISAMLQHYDAIEIVVCDDCRSDAIATIVERNRSKSRFPIRYLHNETPLLEPGNLARGVSEARGEYVKFLYDDDLLMPNAVGSLLSALRAHPRAIMASARRRMIDHEGKPMGESLLTLFPFKEDVILDGKELASFLGQHIYNFIGEPSSVMCRRADVLAFGADIMGINGQLMEWLGDLTLYLKLLRQGDLVMLADTLACFRVSTLQTSQIARDTPHVAAVPYERYGKAVRALGWMRPAELNGTVKVATLQRPELFHDLHLADYFSSGGVLPMGNPDLQAWSHPQASHMPVKDWLAERTLTPVQQRLVDQQRQRIAGQASISVVVLADDDVDEALQVTLASLEAWAGVTTSRLEQHLVSDNAQGGVERLNAILSGSDSEWLLILRAGDELLPSGTLMLDLHLADAGDAHLVYCDELYRTRHDLHLALRPAPNLDYLLSLPAVMAGHWLLRRAPALQVGGFDGSVKDAVEFDLILRLIEAQGLHGITHLAEPLMITNAPGTAPNADEVASLMRHLARRGYRDAKVMQTGGRRYRIDYAHPDQPFVSILLFGDYPLAVLQRCLDSLLSKTRYPFFEICVLGHQVRDASTRDWLQDLQRIGGGKLQIVLTQPGDSLAVATNNAARQARGDYLVLLEGDTCAIHDDWLEQLLNHAQREEVAIVGGRLVATDGRVLQAGLIGGLHGSVGGAFEGVKSHQPGFMQRQLVEQNFSAVSPSCMMVRRGLFEDVGGLDSAMPMGEMAGFDLCCKIAQLGYLTVWTPHATLVQELRQPTRVTEADRESMTARWLGVLASDPAYNANLALSGKAFELERRASLNWRPLAWRPLPVVLAIANLEREAQESRLITPLRAMCGAGLIDGVSSSEWLGPFELERLKPDVVVLQDNLTVLPLDTLRQWRRQSDAFFILDVHAFLSLAPCSAPLDPQVRWNQLSEAASLVDCIVVPTQALADAFAPLHRDVRLLQTRLGDDWGELPDKPVRQGKARIGCAFEPSTSLDPQLLTTVIQDLSDRVDWVLWGEVPDAVRALACEVQEGAPDNDPQRLVELRLDLALAPLGSSGLDACRSPLALLRYGACGYPVICSNSSAYQNDLDVSRVENTPEDWLRAIQCHLADPHASMRQASNLRAQVRQQWVFDGASAALWAQGWARRQGA
ncbi:glycosyltransferase family 2 protein [Pseudomonas sp. NPDC089752]|uniref:glycosyltransferase family 2 protein n=1 Tax=Pseudomonas sp. NPDC089752 TaxID=3364472 RepID=UPI00380C84E6